MVNNLREFYLPLKFLAIIIGYQISIYFFYQYFKYKNEKLYLNKILISYSLFFGFVLTGVLFRNINEFYIEGFLLSEVFLKITNCLFVLSITMFLYFISSKSFNDIINSKLTKILCFVNFIPFVSILILPSDSLILYLSLVFFIIGILYMLFVQLRLIKLSTGKIKIKIIFIFIGELFLGGMMFIGGELSRRILLRQLEDVFFIITIPISIISLMIIFFGVFRFPAFLEFEWKKNLLSVFIVNQRNFNILYNFDFTIVLHENVKLLNSQENLIKNKIFFSRGIFGINDIISGITRLDEGKIEKIRQGDIIILLNQGDEPLSFIVYCLLVNKELLSHEFFLKTIKNQFQDIYRNILLNIDVIGGEEERILKSFDNIIKKIIK